MAVVCEVCEDMRKHTGATHAVIKAGIPEVFEQQLLGMLRKKNLAWKKHLLAEPDCANRFITRSLGLNNPPGRPRRERTTPTEE